MKILQVFVNYGSQSIAFASQLLSRPCQGVLAQRAERSMQLWCLYSKLYDRHSARRVLSRIGYSLHKKVLPRSRNLLLLLSASAPILRLDKASMPNEHNVDEFLVEAMQMVMGEKCSDSRLIRDHLTGGMSKFEKHVASEENWEIFTESESVSVWRRPFSSNATHLWEYLICGSFSDIEPLAFHAAQNDIEYRRKWDNYTTDLQLLKSDAKNEFIKWVVSFPFPLAPREYILCRQWKVDYDRKVIIATNKAIEPEEEKQFQLDVKSSNKTVRVSDYYSIMVVTPHKSLDEPGLDFVLLYFDDPQMPSGKFAQCAQNIGAGTGMRDFLARLQKAALGLQSEPDKRRFIRHVTPDPCQTNNSRSAVEDDVSPAGILFA